MFVNKIQKEYIVSVILVNLAQTKFDSLPKGGQNQADFTSISKEKEDGSSNDLDVQVPQIGLSTRRGKRRCNDRLRQFKMVISISCINIFLFVNFPNVKQFIVTQSFNYLKKILT